MSGRSAVSRRARVVWARFAVENAGAALPGGPLEELAVQLGGEGMDRASQLCVGREFQLLFVEVMIRFGLSASPLAGL